MSFLFKKNKTSHTINGDFMKKLLLLVAMAIVLLISSNDTKKTVPAFSYTDNEYATYEITFNIGILNTNNISDKLNGVQIISVYPYINPIYRLKMPQLEIYTFDNKSISSNIQKFVNHYIKELEEAGYKQDALNARLIGIEIYKVKLYTKSETIDKLYLIDDNLEYRVIYNY